MKRSEGKETLDCSPAAVFAWCVLDIRDNVRHGEPGAFGMHALEFLIKSKAYKAGIWYADDSERPIKAAREPHPARQMEVCGCVGIG